MKKITSIILAFVLLFALIGCAAEPAVEAPAVEAPAEAEPVESTEKVLVGVSMPTKSLQRWNQDGSYLEENLTAGGYDVDLQFAENKIELQVSQIDNMITKGAKVIIIAPIDVSALNNVLASAKEAGVKIISYDRLIIDSDAVDYYATFDNNIIGAIIGQYIVDELGLAEGEGPFNIEIASGPNLDSTRVLYESAVAKIQPYLDNGQLIIRSGQYDMEQTATPNWEEKEWITFSLLSIPRNTLTQFYASMILPHSALSLPLNRPVMALKRIPCLS